MVFVVVTVMLRMIMNVVRMRKIEVGRIDQRELCTMTEVIFPKGRKFSTRK